METITLVNDIKVFFVKAKTYPGGIMAAQEDLLALVPFSKDRKYFGISRPENGGVIEYKAAAEEINPGEAETLNCGTLVLKKGKYTCLTINDYLKNIQGLEKAFKTLLSNPQLDPKGYCVEWYFNENDVKCMVRLKD